MWKITGDISRSSFQIFNKKIQNFYFAPPSDNLWVVEIKSIGDNNANLLQLNENIQSVLDAWSKTNCEKWNIEVKNKDDLSKYFNMVQEGELGIFMAQNINFTPHGIIATESIFPQFQQFGGLIKGTKVVQSIQATDKLSINFLVSNWDIGDLLFDRWIAAIAQNGLLIETATNDKNLSTNLKANIHLYQYSCNKSLKEKSNQSNGDKSEFGWTMRKEYIFQDCFPISRGQVAKNYNTEEAGVYKTNVVTFYYDNYKIKYHV